MQREEAIERMCAYGVPQDEGKFREALNMAIKALNQEPRKGHWIFEKTVFDKFGNTVECSSCHKKWKTYDEIRWKEEHKYCPNCGIKMEVKK